MTAPWVPWALGAALALIVLFVAVLIAADRRKEARIGPAVPEDADVDDSGGDVELLAAVTGLGPERDYYGPQARIDAVELPTDGWELRGARDVDPEAANPWRGDE